MTGKLLSDAVAIAVDCTPTEQSSVITKHRIIVVIYSTAVYSHGNSTYGKTNRSNKKRACLQKRKDQTEQFIDSEPKSASRCASAYQAISIAKEARHSGLYQFDETLIT